MRRIVIVLSALLACMLAGCSPDVTKDVGDENIVVPIFASAENYDNGGGSRGITEMPTDGVWGDDPWRSSAIMQSLPAMIGFEELKMNNFDSVKAEAEERGRFSLIGFDVEAMTDTWRENDDGWFMQYRIWYGKNPVGLIQYYYNKESKCFSYRQLVAVAPVYNMNGKDFVPTPFIIGLEFQDIDVRNLNKVGQFSFGQLGPDGKIEEDALVDWIWLGKFDSQSGEAKHGISFNRAWMSGRSDKDLFQSFIHADKVRGSGLFDHQVIYDQIAKLEDDGDYVIDTPSEAEAMDVTFLINVSGYMYANIRNLIRGYQEGFSSYDDFMSASLEKIDETEKGFGAHEVKEGMRTLDHAINTNPVIFSWSGGKSAAAQTESSSGYAEGPDFASVRTKEKLEKTDFLVFYPQLEGKEGNELVEALVDAHLRACGIEDEDYIANYTYACLEVPEYDTIPEYIKRWPMEVSSMDPGRFRTDFEAALKEGN